MRTYRVVEREGFCYNSMLNLKEISGNSRKYLKNQPVGIIGNREIRKLTSSSREGDDSKPNPNVITV